MQTIDKKLHEANCRPSGFEYMRFALAIVVIYVHSYEVSYGKIGQAYLLSFRSVIGLVLPMFFALSGFLVAGSLERNPSLAKFLYLRALRISPALIVETFLSALVLGTSFTTMPLREYFIDSDFQSYFGNILGIIHYQLPGVFRNNPIPSIINAQLWTVPYELWCYILLSLFFLLKIKKPLDWTIVLIVIHLFVFADQIRPRSICVNGSTLLLCFLVGVAFHRFKKSIIYSPWLFIIAMCLCLCFLAFPKWDALAALPCAYITVYIGCCNPKRQWIVKSGDYSYGMFLYGYALQQAFANVLELQNHFINFAFSLPTAFACAYLSWHYIEKPTLGLKKLITT
jgi:peptidoglycan/LPS O-acetylase OafA/YrhL